MIRVCFVCMGNICRSPTAAGLMQSLLRAGNLDRHIAVESAGTEAYHAGERPDRRAREAAAARGVTLEGRARQFTPDDFGRFDYVVAMDADNRDILERLAPNQSARVKIHMLRSFDAAAPEGAEVPDPYYGGAGGFEEVLEICEAACRGLLAHLRVTHRLS